MSSDTGWHKKGGTVKFWSPYIISAWPDGVSIKWQTLVESCFILYFHQSYDVNIDKHDLGVWDVQTSLLGESRINPPPPSFTSICTAVSSSGTLESKPAAFTSSSGKYDWNFSLLNDWIIKEINLEWIILT